VADSRDDLTNYIRTKDFNDNTMLALRQYINDVGNEVAGLDSTPASRPTGWPTSGTKCM
jgi:hypothetical protein